ncbi:hypothetical protein [Nocardioides sp. CFH 31398]|uniref:hypothetical protein n=1 Tax=Nocardioides sp. CFH 31398 TaxID=2919579 RepID=UPI001F05411D|nr:hypothetical protein [Nocardioides sp. CFH 31398]MCH1865000.1 hypothetical protein [Nocardioides sp. CFH 31398]
MGEPDPTVVELVETVAVSFVEQLAAVAAVDPAVLRPLVESGLIQGLMDQDGRARFVLDEAVPGPDELRALGVEPGRDYDPGDVPSSSWTPDPTDDNGDHGPWSRWTMTWPPSSS